jgi:hypothetical protein
VQITPLFKKIIILFFALVPLAIADDFERSVYDGEINEPGQAGIELHTNYTIDGRRTLEYSGQVPTDHVLRMTLEPSFGITKALELGLYIQTAITPAGPDFAGVKFRVKFILPREIDNPLVLGINFEVGRIPFRYDPGKWGIELRPIIAYDSKKWLLAVNPILEWGLVGPDATGVPEFSPSAKVRYNFEAGVGAGVEYYGDIGPINSPARLSEQKHTVFLVADTLKLPVELNFGIGRGLTAATDNWTVKLVIGKSF